MNFWQSSEVSRLKRRKSYSGNSLTSWQPDEGMKADQHNAW